MSTLSTIKSFSDDILSAFSTVAVFFSIPALLFKIADLLGDFHDIYEDIRRFKKHPEG